MKNKSKIRNNKNIRYKINAILLKEKKNMISHIEMNDSNKRKYFAAGHLYIYAEHSSHAFLPSTLLTLKRYHKEKKRNIRKKMCYQFDINENINIFQRLKLLTK